MHFDLVDRVLELTHDRIVTIKQVTAAEEYLQDHFATFPVLPGVLMLEALVQAGRRLAESRPEHDPSAPPLVLGRVRALKYGRFVKPGAALRAEVSLAKPPEGGTWDLRAQALVLEPGASGDPPVAVSGRLHLRPARVGEGQLVSGSQSG
jgi:3-hydroxyacyl-[acyl-carrier-protein] dehydratase